MRPAANGLTSHLVSILDGAGSRGLTAMGATDLLQARMGDLAPARHVVRRHLNKLVDRGLATRLTHFENGDERKAHLWIAKMRRMRIATHEIVRGALVRHRKRQCTFRVAGLATLEIEGLRGVSAVVLHEEVMTEHQGTRLLERGEIFRLTDLCDGRFELVESAPDRTCFPSMNP